MPFDDARVPGQGEAGNDGVTVAVDTGATRPGRPKLKILMLGPYLFISVMKDVIAPGDRQDTFNRHLEAHEPSTDSYRGESAISSILIAQGLLRQLDRYLHAGQP